VKVNALSDRKKKMSFQSVHIDSVYDKRVVVICTVYNGPPNHECTHSLLSPSVMV
jgi:hypothetical protein